jgi:Outer membrane protein beta-barrel domain
MKKIILLAAAAFFAANATAQDRKVVLGFAVTPVVSFLSAPNDQSVTASGANLGVGIGVFGDYYFAENYAITGGFNFCTNQGGTLAYTKGGQVLRKTTFTDTKNNEGLWGTDTKLTYKNQYLEIPIGIKLRTEETDGLRFYGNPVATFGFRTQSQGNISGTILRTNATSEKLELSNENIGPDMAIMNISVGVGLGAEYRLAERTTVYGGLYYAHGLLDQTNNFKRFNTSTTPVSEEDENSNAQLSSISLRIGVNL